MVILILAGLKGLMVSSQEMDAELTETSLQLSTLPEKFTHDLISEQVASDVANKVGEINLTVASNISDRLSDEVVRALDKSVLSMVSINHTN